MTATQEVAVNTRSRLRSIIYNHVHNVDYCATLVPFHFGAIQYLGVFMINDQNLLVLSIKIWSFNMGTLAYLYVIDEQNYSRYLKIEIRLEIRNRNKNKNRIEIRRNLEIKVAMLKPVPSISVPFLP